MRQAIWITATLALGTTGLAGIASGDVMDYDMTQAGASSPSGIRPGEIVSALDALVLEYNQGMSWELTLTGDPVRVLDSRPVPQSATLGELIAHNDSSYVIYDRLAVRAVLQWIGYDDGALTNTEPVRLGYWTEQGLFNSDGLPWIETGGSGGGGGGAGEESLLRQIPVPEPSTLALTVIAASAMLSMFRRKRYG